LGSLYIQNMSTTDDDNDHQRGGGNEEITSSKKECTLCEQNNVDDITEGIDSIMAVQKDMSTCAACGKEGNSDDMNTCNKCKSVKYCNAACKKKHRTKHKKACERRVAELYDEQLFKEVEPRECPICMLPLPSADQVTTESCCGKTICNGCILAISMSDEKDLCAFCRIPPASSDKEEIKRLKKRIDNGNAGACVLLASYYTQGLRGLPRDYQSANELWLKAGELGRGDAYYNLGANYDFGWGVARDRNKVKYYFELAALNGDKDARHAVGILEGRDGNNKRAMKHLILAARAGNESSLHCVKEGFMNGLVTKDDYANTLRLCHERQDKIKSEERDKAAFLKMAGMW